MRALLLVAAAMAAVRAQIPRDPVDCKINGYTVRLRYPVGNNEHESCCEHDSYAVVQNSCYGEDTQQVDYCAVSHHYHCCGISSSVATREFFENCKSLFLFISMLTSFEFP